MNKLPPLRLAFPPDLSDQAAYEIFEFLEALGLAFEERYFGQIRSHRRASHPTKSEIEDQFWENNPIRR